MYDGTFERLPEVADGKGMVQLMVHHAQIPSLLFRNLLELKDWIRVDFNIGKLVEPAGD